MYKIKLSVWLGKEKGDLSQFTGSGNRWRDAQFYVNDPDCTEADAWIVLDNTIPSDLKCRVPKNKTFFCTGEVALKPDFWVSAAERRAFLAHFSHIYSNFDIPGGHQVLPFLGWFINGNHGTACTAPERDYDFFQRLKKIEKPLLISMFCSNQAMMASHRLRLEFAIQAQNHFKSSLHWYGNGINPVPDKWRGIAPYRYHIALENQCTHNIITEKLLDTYLGLAYPFYSGAPNAGDYFGTDSFTRIDISRPQEAINTIERGIAQGLYENRSQAILDAKDLVLGKLHFIERFYQLATQEPPSTEQQLVELPIINAPCWPH